MFIFDLLQKVISSQHKVLDQAALVQLIKNKRQIAILFLSLSLNMCFGSSKEPSSWDGSFEYPQHRFWLRNKKKNVWIYTLIWRPIYFWVIRQTVKFTWGLYGFCCLQMVRVRRKADFGFGNQPVFELPWLDTPLTECSGSAHGQQLHRRDCTLFRNQKGTRQLVERTIRRLIFWDNSSTDRGTTPRHLYSKSIYCYTRSI